MSKMVTVDAQRDHEAGVVCQESQYHLLTDLFASAEVVTLSVGYELGGEFKVVVIARQRESRHWHCALFAVKSVLGIAEIVDLARERGALPDKDAIAVDPNVATHFIDDLIASGVKAELVRPLTAGAALAPARWGVEHKLTDGSLSVFGSEPLDARSDVLCRAALLMSWDPGRPLRLWKVETSGAILVRAADENDAYRRILSGESFGEIRAYPNKTKIALCPEFDQ